MALGSDGDCPQSLDAEAVGALGDGTPMLLQLRFTVSELSPDDPRQPGDAFVHGRPCPCLLLVLARMSQAVGYMEQL